jgi:predicted TIM-barrel fold metal-dependent hydrolase
VRDHVRLALQPIDAPATVLAGGLLWEQLDAGHFLMFSTDYPHWQYDSMSEAIPEGLTPEQLSRILGDNARDFYRLTDGR